MKKGKRNRRSLEKIKDELNDIKDSGWYYRL